MWTPEPYHGSNFEDIFNSQVDLTGIYNEPTYDELKEALENYLNPSDGEDDESQPISNNESKGNSSTKNIEDAFDKLFND